ncbi:MAG: hemolysin family protein [Proteobacteria bacterium]|nr:hemolysin family protein [Pseudomonadota bacterium]MBU1739595.1 hemolysin family protein [Pseudomonadota bacterium]
MDMDKDPSSDSPGESNIFKRFIQFLGFDRTIDSPEELEHEIQELLDDGQEQGLISSEEGKMIHSILEFRDTVAREIMTPSSEMISVRADCPYDKLVQIIITHGFSRIPVYKDKPDNIIGIIFAKDLLKYMNPKQTLVAADLIKPAYFALENMKIVDLLRDFQHKKVHLAIITDEFGSVRGLTTLEDVLEEIVGEITDETDRPDTDIKILDDRNIIVDARIDIEDVEDHFGVTLPEGPYESIGGMIIHSLGHLPGANTSLTVGALNFTVLSATRRRVNEVRVTSAAAKP